MATKDIWLFSKSDNLEGEILLSTGDNLKSVTGIEKLVNIFVHFFLTGLGSDLIYRSTGTGFAEIIGGNIIFGGPVVKGVILLAVVETKRAILSDQAEIEVSSSIPDDEFLEAATLLDFAVLSDTVNIEIEITSRAGNTRSIKVPIKYTL